MGFAGSDGFVPLMRELEDFKSYCLLDGGPGVLAPGPR